MTKTSTPPFLADIKTHVQRLEAELQLCKLVIAGYAQPSATAAEPARIASVRDWSRKPASNETSPAPKRGWPKGKKRGARKSKEA